MKFQKSLIIAAATLTIAANQPAPRSASPATQNIPAPTTFNCLLASNVFAQKETDPKMRTMAYQTLDFYLGRINPRTTPTQLKTALKLTADGLKGVNAAPLMNACLRDFRAKAAMVQSVAQQLQQGK